MQNKNLQNPITSTAVVINAVRPTFVQCWDVVSGRPTHQICDHRCYSRQALTSASLPLRSAPRHGVLVFRASLLENSFPQPQVLSSGAFPFCGPLFCSLLGWLVRLRAWISEAPAIIFRDQIWSFFLFDLWHSWCLQEILDFWSAISQNWIGNT